MKAKLIRENVIELKAENEAEHFLINRFGKEDCLIVSAGETTGEIPSSAICVAFEPPKK